MDFDLQVKLFVDQLTDLIEQAKFEAAQEFNSDRSVWDQKVRQFEADLAAANLKTESERARANTAEIVLQDLKARIAGLV